MGQGRSSQWAIESDPTAVPLGAYQRIIGAIRDIITFVRDVGEEQSRKTIAGPALQSLLENSLLMWTTRAFGTTPVCC